MVMTITVAVIILILAAMYMLRSNKNGHPKGLIAAA